MKRSEVVIKMTRYYGIRHPMVEAGYITPLQFMESMLALVEEMGMIPPEVRGEYDSVPTVTPTGNHDYGWIRKWEKE